MRKIKAVILLVLMFSYSVTIQAGDDPEPTPTPSQNDLQNQELLTAFQELMQPNEDCQLPCFWGLVPGVSSLTNVEDFWTTTFGAPIELTVADDGRIFASFWGYFVPRSGYTDISINMTFRDEVLSVLKVSTFNTSIWLDDGWLPLLGVLQELPDDTEIYIGVSLPGESGPSTISLILINAEDNFMIQKVYRLRVRGNTISPDSTEPLLLCPTEDNLFYTTLWILADETPISIEETLGNPIFPGSDLAVYQSIELMAQITSEEFISFIQQNPDACVEMLSYSELLALGYSS